MLTFFATPKPFQGHIGIIQQNAIKSWVRLHPQIDLILLGNETGVAEMAAAVGARHVPDIPCNEYGTPLVSAFFEIAQSLARHNLLCYINSDIILMSDYLQAVQQVAQRHPRFLLVGQRCNINLEYLWEFDDSWETRLRDLATQHGEMQGVGGIDYFTFVKGMGDDLPAFAVGRPGWDNWMIRHALDLSIPVVDATAAVLAVHQNHGYGHVPNRTGAQWQGPEGDRNLALAGPFCHIYTLDAANWRLTPQGLGPALTIRHFRQRANAWFSHHFPGLRAQLTTLKQRL